MTNKPDLSRRSFLASTGVLTAGSLFRVGAPALTALAQTACSARDDREAFTVLGKDEALDFSAIAGRIIPTTDTPGADEAGVIYFFDRAFAEEMQDSLPFARAELERLNAGLERRFGLLGEAAQDRALSQIETGGFFELMRVMTIFGFFAMQKHGGNRDDIAWQLIGFEGNRGGWQYPFGHYDAEVHTGAGNDE